MAIKMITPLDDYCLHAVLCFNKSLGLSLFDIKKFPKEL